MSISLDDFKAPNDKCKYRFSILSNGLKVLIIQCPDEDDHDTTTGYRASNEDEDEASLSTHINDANTYQSAACLTVEVGSFADPPCLQGLAHYLEHMLFMGTWQVRPRLLITSGSTKYPEENGFDSFLGQNGGYSNATTDCECTSYVFEVNSDSFKKALDMFASFFISPLLQPEAMDRELCAVESEFQLASQNDHVRLQVTFPRRHIANIRDIQQVLCATSKEHHPYHKFSWGNISSLRDIPLRLGIDVHNEMQTFFDQHYSAGTMSLVACSPHSLDTVEHWITESFSPIKNTRNPPPCYKQFGSPFPDSAPKLIKLIPLEDVHMLHIYFSLPPQVGLHNQKPTEYIRYVVSNKCAGSLISRLGKSGWATNIIAGTSETDGYEFGSYGCLFEIQVTLTFEGLNYWVDVSTVVFEHLAMLQESKNLPNWIFEEFELTSQLAHQYNEPLEPLFACKEYSRLLQSRLAVKPEDILRMSLFQGQFQPSLLKCLLPYFRPNNARVVLVSSGFRDNRPWTMEPWTGVKFACRDLYSQVLDRWMHSTASQAQWPPRNPYIPTDFHLKVNKTISEPLLIPGTSKFWIKPDISFGPKTNAHFKIVLPMMHSDLHHHACVLLYCISLQESLKEQHYLATSAEMDFCVQAEDDGFEIMCCGFSQHIPDLISTIFGALTMNLTDHLSFSCMKQELLGKLRNRHNDPLDKARYLRLLLLEQKSFRLEDIISTVESITVESFVDFIGNDLWSNTCMSGLFHGNIDMPSAQAIISDVQRQLSSVSQVCITTCNHEPAEASQVVTSLPVNPGKGLLIRQSSQHVDEVNNVVEVYYQFGKRDVESNAYANLLQQIMQAPLYGSLRSRQQLGYDVSCYVRNTHGMLGFSIVVQSSKYSLSYVAMRIDHFLLHEFPAFLNEMTHVEFENHVESRRAYWNTRPTTLSEDAHRIWHEITSNRFEFHSNYLFLKALNTVTKDELCRRYEDWILDLDKAKKLRVHVLGQNHKAPHIPLESLCDGDSAPIIVNDILQYKKMLTSDKEDFV